MKSEQEIREEISAINVATEGSDGCGKCLGCITKEAMLKFLNWVLED